MANPLRIIRGARLDWNGKRLLRRRNTISKKLRWSPGRPTISKRKRRNCTLADPIALALREQFHSAEQQRETSTVGMWVFLITEVMLFGGLFTAFSVYRVSHPAAFDQGSADMEFWMGAVNTAVLICSSFCMAMAVHSAEKGKNGRLALFLILTILIGLVFLGIKFTEYYLHYHDQKLPGILFHDTSPDAAY